MTTRSWHWGCQILVVDIQTNVIGELSASCRLIDPETGWARAMELCDPA